MNFPISKKLITTLFGMVSLNYVGYLIYLDKLDAVHKIELYALLISAIAALAGIHGLLQSKVDRIKAGEQKDLPE